MRSTLIGFLLVAFAANTFANDSENTFQPKKYAQFHLGQINTDWLQGPIDPSYLAVGGAFGYQFSELLATEFFMTFSADGEVDPILSADLGQTAKNEFNAFGGYLVAKTPGKFYAKGRVGIVLSRFIYSAGGYEDESESATGLSYGIGAGIDFDKFMLELEYMTFPEVDDPLYMNTSYESDALLLSIGARF